MNEARAVWFERPGVAALRTQPLPAPRAGEVVVRAMRCGVSAGTERIVLMGGVPPAIRREMALATMQGSFDFPVSYGYAAVGVAEELGAGVPTALRGARVLALHPHHDRFVVDQAELRPLPEGPTADRLVLGPHVETAVNVVWDAAIALGDRVVVTGLGVIGLLVAWLAARAGAGCVLGVDPDPERRKLAEYLGATATASRADDRDLSAADILIEASGDGEALAELVDHAGFDAKVVVCAWYGSRATALHLGGAFHPNRVRLQSSQVAAIAPARRGRWTAERRWALVCELLESPVLDRLVAPALPLSEAPRLYAELAAATRWNPPQRVFDAPR